MNIKLKRNGTRNPFCILTYSTVGKHKISFLAMGSFSYKMKDYLNL